MLTNFLALFTYIHMIHIYTYIHTYDTHTHISKKLLQEKTIRICLEIATSGDLNLTTWLDKTNKSMYTDFSSNKLLQGIHLNNLQFSTKKKLSASPFSPCRCIILFPSICSCIFFFFPLTRLASLTHLCLSPFCTISKQKEWRTIVGE